jgi:type II secretory pathway component PulK
MRCDGGIAQLIVLWALLLLGTLAMSFSFAMRTEALAARNGLDGARAYYQARTGINRAVALLSANAIDNLLNGPLVGEEEDVSYDTRVTSEGGKIDINFVAEATLKNVLRNGGLSLEEAETLGDSILDWRDEDDMVRTYGAEAAYYASLPEPLRIRNGNLEGIDELSAIKGVTRDFFTRFLSRVFTVHGSSASVDINAAPPEVLRVLPGFTSEAAEAAVSKRRENPFRSPHEVAAFLMEAGITAETVSILSTSRGTRFYTIVSTGRSAGGVARTVECLVDIESAGGKPIKILRWRDYVAAGEGADR